MPGSRPHPASALPAMWRSHLHQLLPCYDSLSDFCGLVHNLASPSSPKYPRIPSAREAATLVLRIRLSNLLRRQIESACQGSSGAPSATMLRRSHGRSNNCSYFQQLCPSPPVSGTVSCALASATGVRVACAAHRRSHRGRGSSRVAFWVCEASRAVSRAALGTHMEKHRPLLSASVSRAQRPLPGVRRRRGLASTKPRSAGARCAPTMVPDGPGARASGPRTPGMGGTGRCTAKGLHRSGPCSAIMV